MKYCKNCGKEVMDSAVVCPFCGCQIEEIQAKSAESSGLGICAIIFGALGGGIGLLLSIIGLCTYKEDRNRKNCKIGLILFFAWVVIYVIIFAVTLSAAASAASTYYY